ncbi:hypothetical protein KA005_63310 [bacterium]|nr:hypothetical protein [bacterium]
MKAKFIQENVILSEHEGPYGLDPHNDWAGRSVMECYERKYPNKKIMLSTKESRIVNVGDWAQIFYILAEAKNAS